MILNTKHRKAKKWYEEKKLGIFLQTPKQEKLKIKR